MVPSLAASRLPQHRLHRQIAAKLRRDPRITHALRYGSFTQGNADAFSDIEYYFYLAPGTQDHFSAPEWLAFSGYKHAVLNEFGAWNFITQELIRIELHLARPEDMPQLLSWPPDHIRPSRMVLKDPDGQLLALLSALQHQPTGPRPEAQHLLDRTFNWLVFSVNVLRRGERLRALELLGWIQGGLLRLARLRDGNTSHWHNATRRAEWELSPASLARLAQISGPINELETVLRRAWAWLQELGAELKLEPPNLSAELDTALQRLTP